MRLKMDGMLLAVLGLMLWGGAAAAKPVGTVVVVSGPCSDDGRILRLGDAVQIGDTVDVQPRSNLKLQMTDGSVISIAPDSSMRLASYSISGSGRHVELLLTHGLLRAQVTPVMGHSTFEVSTAVGTASVVSDAADWFLKAQAGSAQVGVLAGTIDLASTVTGQSVWIPAHWGTRLKTGLDPVLPRLWAQKEFNAVIRLTKV